MRDPSLARFFVAAVAFIGLAATPAFAGGKGKSLGSSVQPPASSVNPRFRIPQKDPTRSWIGDPPKVADGGKETKAGASGKSAGAKGGDGAKAAGANEGPVFGVEQPAPEGGDPNAPGSGSGESRGGENGGGGGE